MKITLKIDENALPGILISLRKYADATETSGYSHPYGHNKQAVELLRETYHSIVSQRDSQTAMRDLRRDEASERFMNA